MSEVNLQFDPSRIGILFFSRGRGRGHAIPDMAIAEKLLRLRDDADIRFVSYATGAATFTEFEHSVIDLDLPERNSVMETLVRAGHLIGWLQPRLIVAHEEFGVPPAARILGVPVSFITDWFAEPEKLSMQCLHYADEVLFIDEKGAFDEPVYLEGKVQYMGPALRPFRYAPADRGRAREELGLPDDALVISVFVHPGRRIEKVAPIYDLLIPAFDSIVSPNKRLVWLAGEDYEMLRERAKDLADVIIKEEDAPFDRLMVASDLAITKGNRNIVLELAALRVPSISFSHGLNRMDDIRTSRLETNITVPAADIDTQALARRINEMLSSPAATRARDTVAFQDGVAGVAQRLAERIEMLPEKATGAAAT